MHAHREQGPGERPGAQQHVFVGTKSVLIYGHSQKSALVTLQSKYTLALTFENVQGNLSRVSMGGSLYASNGGGGNSSRVSMGGSLYGPAGGSALPGKHSVLLQLEDVRVRRQQVLVAFNKYIYTHIGEYIMYMHIILTGSYSNVYIYTHTHFFTHVRMQVLAPIYVYTRVYTYGCV
jgi:hypothetical protein